MNAHEELVKVLSVRGATNLYSRPSKVQEIQNPDEKGLIMEKSKVRMEIYESDPFGSTCCGPGSRVTSFAAVEELRKTLEERSEIVEKLSEEYKDSVTIRRDTINLKRWNYPEYVRRLMSEDKPVPYVFINEELVMVGKFPSYEEFVALLKARLGQEQE